jgi:hypothetical protein
VKCNRTLAWNFGILALRVSGIKEGSVLEIKSFKLSVREIPRRDIFGTPVFRGSGNRGDRDFGIENCKLPVREIPKRHQSCIPWDIKPFRNFRIWGIIRKEERSLGHSLRSLKAEFSGNMWCVLDISHFGICQV